MDSFKKQLKLAVNVGLKVSKKAVVRNRAKRQVTEILREIMIGEQTGLIKNGFYLFFVAKPNIKDKSFAEISEEVKLLFVEVSCCAMKTPAQHIRKHAIVIPNALLLK